MPLQNYTSVLVDEQTSLAPLADSRVECGKVIYIVVSPEEFDEKGAFRDTQEG